MEIFNFGNNEPKKINPSTDVDFAQHFTNNISQDNMDSLFESDAQGNFSVNLDTKKSWLTGDTKKVQFKNPQNNELTEYYLPPSDLPLSNRLIKTLDLFSEYSKQGSSDITPDELDKIKEEMINTFGERNNDVYTDYEGHRVYSSSQKFDQVFDATLEKYTDINSDNGEVISLNEIYQAMSEMIENTGGRRSKQNY